MFSTGNRQTRNKQELTKYYWDKLKLIYDDP